MSAKRFGIPAEEWDRLVADTRDLLVRTAVAGRTITYGDLAAVVTGGRLQARSTGLMSLVDEASGPLDEATGTTLASLVVRADSGMPGEGYFAWAAAQGLDTADRARVWRREAERVWAAYAAGKD